MSDAAEIQRVIDTWVGAFRDRDVAAALGVHAEDAVSFDIVPPLRYIGTEAYRQPWVETFENFVGPIEVELRDLDITVGTDLAFSRSLNRMTGTMRSGDLVDLWYRWTACFQKRDGQWLIVHDHTSAPTNFADGTAVLDLEP
ncbi:YybH family protein [Nocardia altamirensis]|uniref:YybH family protein n=1 Tax=Nocardia altamirensis TaxID=472158 RepID=UPI0008403A05|nr:nuclear transport factor 2 family protein [Nocardia altamirensis]